MAQTQTLAASDYTATAPTLQTIDAAIMQAVAAGDVPRRNALMDLRVRVVLAALLRDLPSRTIDGVGDDDDTRRPQGAIGAPITAGAPSGIVRPVAWLGV